MDSCRVAPGGDKGRNFSAAPSKLILKFEKVTWEGDPLENTPSFHSEREGIVESHPRSVSENRLASLLENERWLFRKASGDTLCSAFDVHARICACARLDTDTNLKFGGSHEIFEKGLYGWAEQLSTVAKTHVGRLAGIALAHPDWGIENPATWARTHVKEFLDEWWSCGKPPRHAYGRIEVWFKYACDGRPDRFEEPWRAPAWALRGCSQSRPEDLSERLSPTQTNSLLSRRRLDISDGCFRNALDAAEHEVRSDLALKSKPANEVGSDVAAVGRVKGRWHSEDYRTVEFRGRKYSLTRNQSAVVKILHDRLKCGEDHVLKTTVKKAMGSGAGEVKDSFKGCPLWGSLVVWNRVPKGTYSLNLTTASSRKSANQH